MEGAGGKMNVEKKGLSYTILQTKQAFRLCMCFQCLYRRFSRFERVSRTLKAH